ncbi:MAG: type II toxin-antitoxin system VapC family toxin, partial [Alphaproteobacteria bacterium]|nr:type II toxin-antitoxin system VapC family toxin [Alphaproteobacteria bacterium]
MSFLLDTNAVSEWIKPQPNRGLIAWMEGVDEDRVFVSAVTLAELRYGVDRLPAGAKRKRLDLWLREELPLRFEARILSIDRVIADTCGKIFARCEMAGRPIEAMDAFIAATAEVHNLTLVTRNVSDFTVSLKSVLDP